MTYTSNRCIQWYAGLWIKDFIFYVEVHTQSGTVVIMTDERSRIIHSFKTVLLSRLV